MIYCVEDEKNIRELLIYTLETTGFSARGMANSKELKDALKEELPDLILLDIMLPGEDGYSILERLSSISYSADWSKSTLPASRAMRRSAISSSSSST